MWRFVLGLLFLISVLAHAHAYGQALRWTASAVTPHAAGPKAPILLPDGSLLSVRHSTGSVDAVRLIVARSTNGVMWEDHGEIASELRGTDLGDSHLLQLRDGRLWCSYRRNDYRGVHRTAPSYEIAIAESNDGGETWKPHSKVAAVRHSNRPQQSRGLWSSFIHERRDGTLQCYFDDEDTPAREDHPGHQWLMMKTWDPEASQWVDPVVVSRALDPVHLSRDGMPSVVELDDGTMLCIYESVAVEQPHRNVIRSVTSDDGGRTWSWQTRDRDIAYASKGDHLALAPWMIRRADGSLFVVFCTDEDQDQASRSGLPPVRMHLDIKWIESSDNGKTWSRPQLVWGGAHRSYLPGILEIHDGSMQVHCIDYSIGGTRVLTGSRSTEDGS